MIGVRSKTKREPKVHDLTRKGSTWWRPENGGQILRAGGFQNELYYPEQGDFVLLPHPAGGSTRYRVVDFDHPVNQPDPPGQWFATLEFAPRGSAPGGIG